jgi:hypothetical protein
MFVGQNTHIPFLIQALGDDYVLQRGEQVANYVAKVKNMKITNLDVFTSPLTEQSAEVA